MWTEKDDQEIEYGKWNVFTWKTTLAEEFKVNNQREEIWPHWSEGRPTRLRKRISSPDFFVNGVYHRGVCYLQSLDLKWSQSYTLSSLGKNSDFLPSTRYRGEWSGVYRIFSATTTIDRCCGNDPTGTLYIGLAGTGSGNWSILNTRINSILNGKHHAWNYTSKIMDEKFPSALLSVEWAYTNSERKRERFEQNQKLFAEAKMAENWLLWCYKDSFGELLPWNQKG